MNHSTNQQLQYQENEYDYSDNIAAQQSAAEAISLSRSSLSMAMAQGDQINHCNDLRLRNEYIVKKSERLVRGMTWRGWVKNLMSNDIEPIEKPVKKSLSFRSLGNDLNDVGTGEQVMNDAATNRRFGNSHNDNNDEDDDEDDGAFQNVPSELFNQASLITNYKSNVRLLKQCQSKTDYEVCLDVCNALQKSTEQIFIQYAATVAQQQQQYPTRNTEQEEYLREWNHKLRLKFQKTQDLHSSLVFTKEELDSRFSTANYDGTGLTTTKNNNRSHRNRNANTNNRNQLFHGHNHTQNSSKGKNSITKSILETANPTKYKEQEEHLDIMSNNIQELLHATTSINTVLEDQNATMDMLNDGTDDLVESTKMVSRKVDRMRYKSVSFNHECHFMFSFPYIKAQ